MGTCAWYELSGLQLFAAVLLTSYNDSVVQEEGSTTPICCQGDFTTVDFNQNNQPFECQPGGFTLF